MLHTYGHASRLSPRNAASRPLRWQPIKCFINLTPIAPPIFAAPSTRFRSAESRAYSTARLTESSRVVASVPCGSRPQNYCGPESFGRSFARSSPLHQPSHTPAFSVCRAAGRHSPFPAGATVVTIVASCSVLDANVLSNIPVVRLRCVGIAIAVSQSAMICFTSATCLSCARCFSAVITTASTQPCAPLPLHPKHSPETPR